MEVLRPHLALLSEMGLETEIRDDGRVLVRSLPAVLGQVDVALLLLDLADELAEDAVGRSVEDRERRILSTLSCHTSVRAHQHLSTFEMRSLLQDLDAVDFAVCAHGRPVAIRVSAAEIARRFHR